MIDIIVVVDVDVVLLSFWVVYMRTRLIFFFIFPHGDLTGVPWVDVILYTHVVAVNGHTTNRLT